MPTIELTPRFTAQTGEDRKLLAYFGGKRDGVYVEVGAYDGVEMSNSHAFEQIGWSGVLVEADPDLAERCRHSRPRSTVVNSAAVPPGSPAQVTFQVASENRGLSSLELDGVSRSLLKSWTGRIAIRQITVSAQTLNQILAASGISGIDFMTIDVEGHEWSVLRGLDLRRWRPRILILERNGALPERRIFEHLQRHGYRYTGRTGVNDWYERVEHGLSFSDRVVSIRDLYLKSGLLQVKSLLRRVKHKMMRLLALGRGIGGSHGVSERVGANL
jgi:FkbM family methyltransferase